MSYNEIENEHDNIINFMFVFFGIIMIFASIISKYIEEFDVGLVGIFFIFGGLVNLFLIKKRS